MFSHSRPLTYDYYQQRITEKVRELSIQDFATHVGHDSPIGNPLNKTSSTDRLRSLLGADFMENRRRFVSFRDFFDRFVHGYVLMMYFVRNFRSVSWY